MTDKLDQAAPGVARVLDAPQGERLAAVADFFRQRGLLGQRLVVEVQGASFRVECDGEVFSVHRLNLARGLPPGAPGWLVCRLDQEGLYEECDSPELSSCRLSDPHRLGQWLEAVDRLAVETAR